LALGQAKTQTRRNQAQTNFLKALVGGSEGAKTVKKKRKEKTGSILELKMQGNPTGEKARGKKREVIKKKVGAVAT